MECGAYEREHSGRLFVDGNPVVDNRHKDGPPKEGTGRVGLKPGTHRLEVEYSWRSETGYLEVSWTPPGGERALIGGEGFSVKGGLWWPGKIAYSEHHAAAKATQRNCC